MNLLESYLSPQASLLLKVERIKQRAETERRQKANRFASDPVSFAESIGFMPDGWQSRLLVSDSKSLLLNCARQSGKSTVAALVAVHRAVHVAKSLILLVSPSLRQSSELFRKVSDWLAQLPIRPHMPEDNKLSCVLDNGSRIVSLPSSESTIRGFSAVDLVIFDEASRLDDPLYFSVRPMLAISRGRLIAMSTPFGKRGWWYEAWANGGAAWERIEVNATQNPRITQEFLDAERRAMGDWWYRQEYLCQFVETTDQVFSYELVMSAMDDSFTPLYKEIEWLGTLA